LLWGLASKTKMLYITLKTTNSACTAASTSSH
jgi:hypothetical protein